MKEIKVVRVREHYEIYVDNKLYCSCDNWTEVNEDLKNLEKEYNEKKAGIKSCFFIDKYIFVWYNVFKLN